MPISPGVNLISTIPLNKKITSVCFNTNQIILNGDGYILKMSSGLDCTMFIMTLKIKRWLTQINDTIHIYDLVLALLGGRGGGSSYEPRKARKGLKTLRNVEKNPPVPNRLV